MTLLDKAPPVRGGNEPPVASPESPALGILSQITASLAANDPESVLERFLSTMVQLSGAKAGAVRIMMPDGRTMGLIGAVGLPAEVLRKDQIANIDCGVCGAAMRDDDIRWATDLRPCSQATACDYFDKGCGRIVAVPLQSKGSILGVYNLFLEEGAEISAEVEPLLRTIGELLGLTLENARLTRENLRVSLMNERQMMANELHDSLAQTLHYMKMRMSLLQQAVRQQDQVRSFKYMTDVNEALDGAYSRLRELLTHFRNRMDPHGLIHALQETVDGFYDKAGVVLYFANHVPDLRLSIEQETQVFQIIQEALANVRKHSGARHARLILDKRDDGYEFTIEDDGVGIAGTNPGRSDGTATNRPEADTVHFGINIMRERARHIGGRIEIESPAGRGTRVRLCFPVGIAPQEPEA